MLITLLAWIYVTFLSWIWGYFFLQLINLLTKTELSTPHYSIICISGLSGITVVAGILSLFIPLGNLWVQLLFIIPCLFFLFTKREPSFFNSLINEFTNLHLLSKVLFCSLLILILVMSSRTIVHPDTLGYHAQTIQWIEKYKAVPGIVHLHPRFGYQGLWFVDNALFDFSFSGISGITFLNSTVILWFFIFIINRIDNNFFKEGKRLHGLLWITLLLASLWSYTQVRLTVTSASPDFIATLFVLLVIYLLIEKNIKHRTASDWLLVALLSLVSVTIKLSVAPILLIASVAAILILSKKKTKLFFTVIILFVLTTTPFIARNIISSGYVAFPSTSIDIANVDWKYDNELTVKEKNYITAYAKKPGVRTKKEIDTVNNMGPAEWLPNWWQLRSIADKTILITLLLSFILALLSIKKILRSGFIPLLALATMLTGIIFWFVNAPDPRFGFASILGFISIVVYLFFNEKEILFNKTLASILLIISSIAVITYSGYRFINFFEKDQWLKPSGIEKTGYTSFDCDGIKINTPSNNNNFGVTPIPCTDLGCDKFSPRGSKITDGFRAK